MNIIPHLLLGTGRLIPYRKVIISECKKAIRKITEKIPISHVDIVISHYPQGVIPEIGIGGYTPSAHVVYLYLDPKFPSFTTVLKKEIKRILTHELHHAFRWRKPGYGNTLLEAMISEGLADHFDLEIHGGNPQLWSTALSMNQLKEFWKKAQKDLHNKKYDRYAWLYGSKEKRISRWTAYSLGFDIINKYLQRHPDKKPSQISTMRAEKFLYSNSVKI